MAFFDVILPTYNRAHRLTAAIESVLAQDFTDFCLYVIDDGSTDDTSRLLSKWRDPRLHWVWTPNGGVSRARNFGVSLGRSAWLAFLDSDDQWKPSKLQKQHQHLKENPHLQVVHTEEIWIRDGNQVLQGQRHQKSGGSIFARSLELCLISPSAVVLSRQLFEGLGGFREDFPVCEDYDLWLQITARHEIGFLPEALVVKHGGHNDQLSRKFKAMDYWRVKSLRRLLQSNQLTPEQRRLATATLLKKCSILLAGYRKHQNYLNFEEVQSCKEMQEAFQPWLISSIQ